MVLRKIMDILYKICENNARTKNKKNDKTKNDISFGACDD